MFKSHVVSEAASWVGTPYSNHKRKKGIEGGVDCLNFIAGVFEECGGLKHITPRKYDRKFWLRNPRLLLDGVLEALCNLTQGTDGFVYDSDEVDWQLGDVLLVETVPGLIYPNHAVILSGTMNPQTWILHADSVRGRVVMDVLPPNWKPSHIVRISRP
jgi:cell wall-associated NlpC family hydrolase